MKIELSHDKLDSIDFSRYKKYDLDIGNRYFYMPPGKEHYKLLAYLSTLFKNRVLFEIGTNHGCSALALGYNQDNRVYTVDIIDNKKEKFESERNISFHIGDAFDIMRCIKPALVFMDADKSDDFEQRFIDKYFNVFISSRTLLIMDDFHRYQIVRDCIKNIEDRGIKVYDLTKYGHTAGTHLADFGGGTEIDFED